MLGVVCWKWKPARAYRSAFGPETVNILKQMIKRHYNKPHTFICVTDDPDGLDPDIKVIPLWDEHKDVPNPNGIDNPSCYRRLRMFGPDAEKLFGKRFVSLDLDTVVTGNLSPLWDVPDDCKFWGDTSPGTHYNGSMMLLTAGARPKVWSEFNPERSPGIAKGAGQFGSDQGWISYCLGKGEKKWSVDDGVFSYRIHIRNRRFRSLPDTARIVMFHGASDPWSDNVIELPWVKENWRYDPLYKGTMAIEAINIERGLAMLSNGKYIKIKMMYDYRGVETDNIHRAVSFVAGYGEHYWSDLFSHFRKIRAH